MASRPLVLTDEVAAFARRLDKVPARMIADLKKVVLESSDGDEPFQRRRRGILVPPMSTDNLRGFVCQVRSVFVEEDQVEFPIMDVIEFRLGVIFDGFYIDVRDKPSMGEDEGRVIAGTNGLALREDVYEGAWKRNGRDRFTACHELGHFLMHRAVTMARTREDTDKIFCDAEWQADTFAGTLLMSPHHLGKFRDPDDAARQCGITGGPRRKSCGPSTRPKDVSNNVIRASNRRRRLTKSESTGIDGAAERPCPAAPETFRPHHKPRGPAAGWAFRKAKPNLSARWPWSSRSSHSGDARRIGPARRSLMSLIDWKGRSGRTYRYWFIQDVTANGIQAVGGNTPS
jgi:hypothetical protein